MPKRTTNTHHSARSRLLQFTLYILLQLTSAPSLAEPVSLLSANSLLAPRGLLVTQRAALPLISASSQPLSLIETSQNIGIFAALPPRANVHQQNRHTPRDLSSNIERLRAIIGRAESRKNGYDAVQHGAKIKPPKPPTELTLSEIYKWIEDTPGQQHAIGRYQFIPKTLKHLVAKLGLSGNQRFSPEIQDALSDVLLVNAGYIQAQSGLMPRHTFMNNLAKIWAGLPTTSGKSYYDGYAGNRASITWAEFEAEMKLILPNQRS